MSAIDLNGKDAEWMQLFNMIRVECPHARIENLVVVEGAPWGYAQIRFSKVPPRPTKKPGPEPEERFNSDWEWFIGECQELSDGIILEVNFRDGNPITVFGIKSPMGRFIDPKGAQSVEARGAMAFA